MLRLLSGAFARQDARLRCLRIGYRLAACPVLSLQCIRSSRCWRCLRKVSFPVTYSASKQIVCVS